MKKVLLSLVMSLIVVLGVSASQAQALTWFTDRALWEAAVGGAGSFADVDIAGQVPEFSDLTAGSSLDLAGINSVSFDTDLEGLQVGSSWATWSGGNTPRVLYTNGSSSVYGTFGSDVYAFGLEMEPDSFDLYNMDVCVLDGGNCLSQEVDGYAGAAFFGWVADSGESINDISLSTDDYDFAFGRMVIANHDGPEPTVPEPATMSLLGLGLLGFLGRRKIKA